MFLQWIIEICGTRNMSDHQYRTEINDLGPMSMSRVPLSLSSMVMENWAECYKTFLSVIYELAQ
jgi:hypothetical protein